MSTVAFVRLIFLKDVRALRYPLSLLLALAVMVVVLTARGQPLEATDYDAVLNPSLWSFFLFLGGLLLTIQLIHLDPAGREFRFLLTRPVPGTAVGLAKGLLLTLFLILPYWLSLEAIIAASHLRMTPLDHLLLFIETTVTCGSSIVIVVLFSVFTRNGLITLVAYIGLWVIMSILLSWWRQGPVSSSAFPTSPNLELARIAQFRGFLLAIVFLGCALLAIGWRYRTRTFRLPLAIVLGGIILSVLCSSLFPYDLTRYLRNPADNSNALSPVQLSQIHLAMMPPKKNQPAYSLSGGGWNKIYYVNLSAPVLMEGVEPPYFVQTIGYHAVITLRSGKTIVSDYDHFPGHGGVGNWGPSLAQAVAGISPVIPLQKETTLDLATYLPRDFSNENITGATIKGTITLDVRRAYVAASLPLKVGASFGTRMGRYEITRVEFFKDASDNRLAINLNILQMPLILRGDVPNWNLQHDYRTVAIYRPLNLPLQENSSGSGGSGSGFGVQVSHMNYMFGLPPRSLMPNQPPLPPDLGADANLVFVGSKSCGHITCPYEIDNVDLNYRF